MKENQVTADDLSVFAKHLEEFDEGSDFTVLISPDSIIGKQIIEAGMVEDVEEWRKAYEYLRKKADRVLS